MRAAHGWFIAGSRLFATYLRPALRAVPPRMAARLGRVHIHLDAQLADPDAASRWLRVGDDLRVEVANEDVDPHDLALEALLCLGQSLWERTTPAEREAWWKLLAAEMEAGVTGEIDENALREKRALLAGRVSARSRRRFLRYAAASFAGTAAEYVHCLWHDVTVREGPDHLPSAWLRRRLDLLSRCFPPGRGHRLFPIQ